MSKRYVEENNELLLTALRSKKFKLRIISDSRKCTEPCTDISGADKIEFIINSIIKNKISIEQIIIDDMDFSDEQMKMLTSWADVYIHCFNNKNVDKYISNGLKCYNYISTWADYNKDADNVFLINDDNESDFQKFFEADYKNVKFYDCEVTQLSDTYKKFITKKILGADADVWNCFETYCYVEDTITVNAQTLEIVPCSGITDYTYVIATIGADGNLQYKNNSLLIRYLFCKNNDTLYYCDVCQCKNSCCQKCLVDNLAIKRDPNISSQTACSFNKQKAIWIAHVLNKLGWADDYTKYYLHNKEITRC